MRWSRRWCVARRRSWQAELARSEVRPLVETISRSFATLRRYAAATGTRLTWAMVRARSDRTRGNLYAAAPTARVYTRQQLIAGQDGHHLSDAARATWCEGRDTARRGAARHG